MKDIIEKYNLLLEEAEDLKSDIEELKSSIEVDKESVKGINSSINKITEEELGENSPLIIQEFNRLMKEYSTENNRRIAEINDRKKALINDIENRKRKINIEISGSLKSVNELKNIYNDIATLTYLGEYPGEVEIPTETISELKDRVKELKEYCEIKLNKNNTTVKKLANMLSLYDVFCGIENNKVALGCMTAYLIGIVLLVCKLPAVFLCSYLTLTVLSIIESMKNKSDLNYAKAMYKVVRGSYSNYQNMLKSEFDEKSNALIQEIDNEYTIKLEKLTEEMKEVYDEYNALVTELNNKRKDPKSFKEILDRANIHLNKLKSKKARAMDSIESSEELLEDKLSELKELLDDIKQYKEEITKYYYKELTVGKERLMIKSFFTGFNYNGTASLVEFNANTLIIAYTGIDSSCNNELSLLIATQIFTEVSVGSLRIEVFDINQGAQRFAPYTMNKLADVVHINRTPEQCSDTIKDVHSLIDERSRVIYPLAENIEEYNKLMLAKKSLTMSYVVLIVQDAGQSIYNNDKFIQLCKTGPPLGIIPIIMLPLELLNNIIVTGSNDASIYLKFLKSINTPIYLYNNSNDSIERAKPSFRGEYITKFEKVLKGVK